MIPAIQYAMHAVIRQLIGHIGASITKNTTIHVELDVRTNILRLKRSALEFITRAFFAMLVAQVLQMAFACLITNGQSNG